MVIRKFKFSSGVKLSPREEMCLFIPVLKSNSKNKKRELEEKKKLLIWITAADAVTENCTRSFFYTGKVASMIFKLLSALKLDCILFFRAVPKKILHSLRRLIKQLRIFPQDCGQHQIICSWFTGQRKFSFVFFVEFENIQFQERYFSYEKKLNWLKIGGEQRSSIV